MNSTRTSHILTLCAQVQHLRMQHYSFDMCTNYRSATKTLNMKYQMITTIRTSLLKGPADKRCLTAPK